MFMLMNSDGEILIDSIEVKHNFEGFEKIRKQVETFDINDLTEIINNALSLYCFSNIPLHNV